VVFLYVLKNKKVVSYCACRVIQCLFEKRLKTVEQIILLFFRWLITGTGQQLFTGVHTVKFWNYFFTPPPKSQIAFAKNASYVKLIIVECGLLYTWKVNISYKSVYILVYFPGSSIHDYRWVSFVNEVNNCTCVIKISKDNFTKEFGY
jgi:hypothetical protein